MKRDKIFLAACCLSAAGLALALFGYDAGLLLFVAAYLLRPALHEFGLAKQAADERELMIHSRSGNIAFITMVLAAVGFSLWRIAMGERPEELYELIAIGLAARALTGLVMAGDYRKAGAVIIGAVGVFLSLFVMVDAGLSVATVFGVGVGLVIVGFAFLSRRFPFTTAIILTVLVLGVIFLFDLYQFRTAGSTMWLFFVTPLSTAAACLFLGRAPDDEVVSGKARSIVFGSLAVGAAAVFALLMVNGSGADAKRDRGRTIAVKPGEVTIVQGVPCRGSFERYPDGKLKSCVLAREDTLSGQLFAEGTVVNFTPEGIFDWCFLQEDTFIQGHLCRGETHGFMTHFHPNGKLKLAWLGRDEVIQGIPCSKFTWFGDVFGGASGVSFHPNGMLNHCKLSKAVTIGGRTFKKGEHVRFDQNGKLKELGITN
jgi:hypothetical protein